MGSVGTLFSIVNLTSTSTSAVDWHLYRKAKSGKEEDRVEVANHLALDTLNTPNRFWSRQHLFEAGQQHIDLTGEGWIVCETVGTTGWPVSMWLVRPDRIRPVQSATEFISGYIYTGPDGEEIPLTLDQVMSIQMPDPDNVFRGLGPVQSILRSADSIRYSVEWNGQFFANGAEPGGIIEVDTRLDDVAFKQMTDRWAEQHRGISNAHRVAVIENAHWVDRKYSHNDMQFSELMTVSRDQIREAFAIHPHMLGDSDDVNLANATAAEVTFARRSILPRLARWKDMLNRQYLPKFGPTAEGLEFDYDNPVAEDEAADAETFMNRSRGVQWLVQSGYDGEAAAAAAGLPDMKWSADRVVRSATEIAAPVPDPAAGGGDTSASNRVHTHGGGDVHPKV